MKHLIAVAVMALAVLTAGRAQAQINTGDPKAVMQALIVMGYKPGPIDDDVNNPTFFVPINDVETGVVFGSCQARIRCQYFTLVTRFTDVSNPPAAWLDGHNSNLDLGKAWLTKEGQLAISMPVPTGAEATTPAAMRFILDQWSALLATISQSAIDEKLTS